FCRFKTEKDGQEKKRYQSSNTGADGRSQGKSPNGSKTTDNSLIQSEKRKRIVIQFKSKEIKHGKSTSAADIVTTRRENRNKGPFDGTEGKRLWHSFAVQRDKVVKKKKEKVELCKLKAKAEQTMLEKFNSSVYDLHIPRKKANRAKKWNDDVRIPKKPPSTSTETVDDDRPFTKKSNKLSRTCEEEYEEGYEEFSKKNQHANKCTPSTEAPQQWDHCKWKKQGADSHQAPGSSGTEEGDFEATALRFKQSFEVFPPPQGSENLEGDQEMQIVEDLHVARIEKRMALSVVQTCGELTNMEIDLPEQDLNISAGASASGLNILVVIDTNIMISHLEFVKSLKSEDIPGIGRLALIIPWVVLQELDNLKKGKMLQHVRDKAIPAVQFIYMCLKNQDSKLWGQSMQLASQKTYGLSDENNDDRVLQCCLQYQSLFPQAVVILCTTGDFRSAFQLKMPLSFINRSNGNLWESIRIQVCNTEFRKTERSDAHLAAQFPNILPDLEKNLGEALSCILETEMKIAFGNLWMEILYLKPPWTLANLLQCYKKHWVAVICFCFFFFFNLRLSISHISVCTCKNQGKNILMNIYSNSHSRSDYNGVLPQAYAEVNKLYQTFTEVRGVSVFIYQTYTFIVCLLNFYKVRSDSEKDLSEDIMVLSESAPCERMEAMTPNLQNCEEKKSPSSIHVAQESRHQEIWSVLEGVWNTMNLYSLEIFRKLDPLTVTAKSSFEEAFLGLQKLLAAVNDILEGIRRVLTPTSTFQDIWTLYNFLISNEINNSIKFTAEELYECVSQELYRERLEVGCCQLAQLEHTIKQCNASAHMEAKNRGWL
ncbi:SWT1 protein, partial [Chauna torquata]|nr:SWT1 protein [Chauna torquata]